MIWSNELLFCVYTFAQDSSQNVECSRKKKEIRKTLGQKTLGQKSKNEEL